MEVGNIVDMVKNFDLIVLGGGSGLNVASVAAQRGLKVAVIEPGPLGGTCLNRGCIPSKMVIEAGEVAQTIRHSPTFGIQGEVKSVDFAKIMESTMGFVDEEARGIEEAIKSHPQYTLYKHFARFTGPKKLSIGNEEIEAEKIVIAAGTRPFIPPIPGLDKTVYHTSDSIFRLKELPKSMIFIGGGYISCELAYFFGALGSQVTVLDRGTSLLSNEDGQIAQTFTKVFGQNYGVVLEANIKEVAGPPPGQAGAVAVKYTVGKEDKEQTVTADLLLVATGRVANSDSLQLKEAGYKLSERGFIEVNEFMETSVAGVWALGDIVGKAPFKHGANYEAKIVSQNIFAEKDQKVAANYTVMPHAVYSYPQVAGVGLMEEQAQKMEIDYVLGVYPYMRTGMGRALHDEDGFMKVLADRKTRRIIGAHIIGTDASILIHELVVVMAAAGGDVEAVKNTIHIHPSLSEVVARAVNSISWEGKAPNYGKTLMERTTEQKI